MKRIIIKCDDYFYIRAKINLEKKRKERNKKQQHLNKIKKPKIIN